MAILCQMPKGGLADELRKLNRYNTVHIISGDSITLSNIQSRYTANDMFDSFIKPRAEPHLTEAGDAGKTDWVMRNPGKLPSLPMGLTDV